MGMYTELHLKAILKNDTEFLTVITYMIDNDSIGDQLLKHAMIEHEHHPFFKTERWRWCLRGGSAYFEQDPFQRLERNGKYWEFEFCANIKNYNEEWQHLMSWLSPYTYRVEGTYQYEEDDEPQHLRLVAGQIQPYGDPFIIADPRPFLWLSEQQEQEQPNAPAPVGLTSRRIAKENI